MPSVNSKELVDEIIASNGVYQDDPPVQSIVEYTNAWGRPCYGLNYSSRDDYTETEFVRNPKIIFVRKES